MKKINYIFLLLALLYACGGGGEQGNKTKASEAVKKVRKNYVAIADESIKSIFDNIPSPLEISELLRSSGIGYNKDYLNDPVNGSKYDTDFKKAVNLGIYGTDLGYINIYKQNHDAIDYIGVIRDMANDLNVGQFFDFNSIQKLVSNSDNIDSLLLVTTQNYNKMNKHLQEQNRADISALILTGGWLEALNTTIKVYEGNKENKDIKEKIGEQKIVIGQLWKLFEKFKENIPRMKKIYDLLKPLKKAFDKVDIIKIQKDPIVKEIDGVVYIEDQSETNVKFNGDSFNEIVSATNTFRNELIK